MRTAIRSVAGAILLVAGLVLPLTSQAERADRDKPINVEADRITVDDRNKTQVLEGKVVLTQGTLVIRAEKVVVTQDQDGFQKGVATSGLGGLARFRQKQDGKDEYIEGEAERIEHDSKNEKTEFFNRAYVKNGQDEVRGQYISYDARTENYLVTSGPNATSAAASGGRVRAIIQPKSSREGSRKPDASKPGEPGTLKSSSDLIKPRLE